LIGQASLE